MSKYLNLTKKAVLIIAALSLSFYAYTYTQTKPNSSYYGKLLKTLEQPVNPTQLYFLHPHQSRVAIMDDKYTRERFLLFANVKGEIHYMDIRQAFAQHTYDAEDRMLEEKIRSWLDDPSITLHNLHPTK